jgi:hypothetical protein
MVHKMMKKMKSKIIILISLALLFLANCEDFLKEKTYNQMTPELLFTDAGHAQLSVNALYAEYFNDFQDMKGYWPALWMQVNQEHSFYSERDYSDLKWDADNNQVFWMWRGLYRAINACNTAIDGISKMGAGDAISQEEKNQLLGEARFMRAHGYYYLLRLWGGVPLHNKPTRDPEKDLFPRSSAQAIFEIAVADLKFAQANLPVNYQGGFPDNGRATKGAATATLAQLYACVSGVQFEGNDPPAGEDADFNNITAKYWSEARAELASMIDENNPSQAKAPYMYSLEPDYAMLYAGGEVVSNDNCWPVRAANDLGQEIIWAANYEPSLYRGTWYFNHWASRFISPYLLDRFVPNGYRAVVTHDSLTRANLGRIVNAKIKRNWPGNNNENNIYWARYGGILLLMAEVENEVNSGPTPLAEACLNAVRQRVRNGDGTTTYSEPADIQPGLSYEAFKDEVYDERAVELYLEFKFWGDLQRSGRLERDWAILASGEFGDRGTYDPKWKFLPIPYREIITSGGLLKQNPGH